MADGNKTRNNAVTKFSIEISDATGNAISDTENTDNVVQRAEMVNSNKVDRNRKNGGSDISQIMPMFQQMLGRMNEMENRIV